MTSDPTRATRQGGFPADALVEHSDTDPFGLLAPAQRAALRKPEDPLWFLEDDEDDYEDGYDFEGDHGEDEEAAWLDRVQSLAECYWGVRRRELSVRERTAGRLLARAWAGDHREGRFPVPPLAIFAALQALRSLRREVEFLEERLVRSARSSGLGWSDIGRALGVSRQTAWARWRPIVDGDVQTWVFGRFGPGGQLHVLRRSDQTEAICGRRNGTALASDAGTGDSIDCAQCREVASLKSLR